LIGKKKKINDGNIERNSSFLCSKLSWNSNNGVNNVDVDGYY